MSTNKTTTESTLMSAAGYENFDTRLIVAKVTAMVLLGFTSLFMGIMPLEVLKRWRSNSFSLSPDPQQDQHHENHSHPGDSATGSKKVSLMLCFGGGVLLCTTLLHVQPEVRERVLELQAKDLLFPEFEYMGDLLFCLGMFMIFVIDQLVHDLLKRCGSKKRSVGGVGEINEGIRLDQIEIDAPRENGHQQPSTSGQQLQERYRSTEGAGDVEKQEQQEHHDEELESSVEVDAAIRGLFAVLALSIHEIFEGMIIGLNKLYDDVWLLLLAVASHKLVIAFCIGLELAYSGSRRSMVILYVATFSMVTPIGIAIGMGILNYSSEAGALGPMAVVLQGLAAGTLMYVVFFEVLGRHKKSGWLHLLAIVIGFGAILSLQLCTHHHHHHGFDHGNNHHEHDHHGHDHYELDHHGHDHHGHDHHGHDHDHHD